MALRMGVNVGETFTDFLLLDDKAGTAHTLKTPATPHDHLAGILAGIRKLVDDNGIESSSIQHFIHAISPIVSDLIARPNVRVGLIVSRGFEHVLHMARARAIPPGLSRKPARQPEPLADSTVIRGVPERMDTRGNIVTPLDETAANEAIAELVAAGVDSLAVALLHACANPLHERRIGALAAERAPELHISLSSDALPHCGEYERTAATVMNARAHAGLRDYFNRLESGLGAASLRPRITVGRADGGSAAADHTVDQPIYALHADTAAGALGAAAAAARADIADALALDIGSKHTTVTLIHDGNPLIAPGLRLGNHDTDAPAVAVRRARLAGSAIARVTRTGALRVGPENAGAIPGPACLGGSGGAPTVTDAHAVLGRLPATLCGSSVDVAAAEAAVNSVARPLGIDAFRAAQAILDFTDETLLGALRRFAAENGRDPETLALVAHGGAGPLHANALAALAGCFPVVVPPAPGVLSAFGLLCTGAKNTFAKPLFRRLDDLSAAQLTDIIDQLAYRARNWLNTEGVGESAHTLACEVDLAWRGFTDTLSFPVAPADFADGGGFAELEKRFRAAHERRYGCTLDRPIEVASVRMTATGPASSPSITAPTAVGGSPAAAIVERRQVYFNDGWTAANIYDRARLAAGQRVDGPAIIMQHDATTVILPGHVGDIDKFLNILISPQAS